MSSTRIDGLRSLLALETLLFHIDDDDSSRHVLHLRPYLPKSPPGGPQSQPHPTPTTFEPNSIYATGTLFAGAFRNSSQSQHPSRRFDNPQQQQHQNQNPSTPASLYIHDELSFLTSSTRSVSGTPLSRPVGLGTRCPWPVFIYTR